MIGTIPKELTQNELPLLTTIRISETSVTGTKPAFISPQAASGLESIKLDGNDLTGTIPWSTMIPSTEPFESKLSVLDVSGNTALSGKLPSDIGRLKGLTKLAFDGTSISGSIPRSIGGCESLKEIWCKRSGLVGTVPTEIGKLTQLGLFDCPLNNLSGKLPTELGLLSAFVHLDISSKMLTGTIPSELRSIPFSVRFDISNQMGGGTYGKVRLHGNDLTRTIPFLGPLAQFNLSFNKLSGTLSDEYRTWGPQFQ